MTYGYLENIEESGTFMLSKAIIADADDKPDPEWRIYEDRYLIRRDGDEQIIREEYERLVKEGKPVRKTYIVTETTTIIETREVKAMNKREAKQEGKSSSNWNKTQTTKITAELKKEE